MSFTLWITYFQRNIQYIRRSISVEPIKHLVTIWPSLTVLQHSGKENARRIGPLQWFLRIMAPRTLLFFRSCRLWVWLVKPFVQRGQRVSVCCRYLCLHLLWLVNPRRNRRSLRKRKNRRRRGRTRQRWRRRKNSIRREGGESFLILSRNLILIKKGRKRNNHHENIYRPVPTSRQHFLVFLPHATATSFFPRRKTF